MTTQFEIGKKYASQYNSGVITIIKRTTKFVTFTEEINGQSMKSMIINGNGEISQGKAIETRKSIKVLNDSEYLSNGICSYYATSEIVEEPIETEEVVSDDQKDNGVIQFENGKKYGTEDGYVGDSVNYCHSLSDEWKSFVQEYMSYARYVYIAKDEKELLDTISPYLLPNDAVMLSPKMTALNDSVMLSPSNLSSQIKELRQQLKADLECLMSSELTNKKARKDSLIKDYETEINELIIKSRKQVI